MKLNFGTFWQSLLVWLLLLASLGTLSFNSFVAFLLPGQEQSVRSLLHKAAKQLAAAADTAASSHIASELSTNLDSRLEQLTESTLKDFPGVEGGFYVSNGRDRFTGYAFPSRPIGPARTIRHDPPPREEPYIRLQARQSVNQEGENVEILTRDVGPSRVAVATTPVGKSRPAELVVWLMYRVTGPEQHRVQMERYRVSTYFALGGLTVSLLLTWRLGRTISRDRQLREQLKDELRRSEHLAALGTLLAQVAHEIRNPLAGIRSTVQLWERLPEQSRTPESLRAVVSAVDRLAALLNHLLYFSRNAITERSRISLNQIVCDVIELNRAQATKQNVELSPHLDLQLPVILGSDTAIRQVVLNLVTNALQAMPTGGRMTYHTRHDSPKKMIILEISDTGPGIDSNAHQRLFEPFFTTRPQGTGLGLALCREIVVQHEGTIDLKPCEPHGTTCRIELPMA